MSPCVTQGTVKTILAVVTSENRYVNGNNHVKFHACNYTIQYCKLFNKQPLLGHLWLKWSVTHLHHYMICTKQVQLLDLLALFCLLVFFITVLLLIPLPWWVPISLSCYDGCNRKHCRTAEQNNDVHVTILKTEEKTGFQNLCHKIWQNLLHPEHVIALH